MNHNHERMLCLTPLTRVTIVGQECILANLSNGKWIKVSVETLRLLEASNSDGILAKCREAGLPDDEVDEFVKVLIDNGFVDASSGCAQPKTLVFHPRTAYLNITNQCNLACHHCYFGSHPGLTHGADDDSIRILVDRLHDGGIQNLVVTGGEPLSRPGFEGILGYIGDHDFREVTLLTNGSLITPSVAELIAEVVDNVHISLDGPTEDVHARLRGRGNFSASINGIHLLKNAGVSAIRIVTSITSVNIEHLRDMRTLKDELGVELGTSIFAEVGRGNKNRHLAPDVTKLIRFFSEEAVSLNCDSTVSDRSSLDVHAGVTCGSGTLMVSVDCFGDVYPCHLLHRSEMKIGNLIQENDFREMIRQSRIVAQFHERTVESRKCHGCSVEYFCKGGCLAHTFAAKVDSSNPWRERDPYCEVHRSILGLQLWQGKS